MCARVKHNRYWYRNNSDNYSIFKGKISASRLFRFIGGSYFDDNIEDFHGNHLTRHGRATEPKIALAHLKRFTQYTAYETGTFAHPLIPDTCGTPDAILMDETRTRDTIPAWLTQLWESDSADGADMRDAIDWSRGILEIKAMMRQDKKHLGPQIKAEHICQMYWAMICSDTHWGECIRCCDEAKVTLCACVCRAASQQCRGPARTRVSSMAPPRHGPASAVVCQPHAH